MSVLRPWPVLAAFLNALLSSCDNTASDADPEVSDAVILWLSALLRHYGLADASESRAELLRRQMDAAPTRWPEFVLRRMQRESQGELCYTAFESQMLVWLIRHFGLCPGTPSLRIASRKLLVVCFLTLRAENLAWIKTSRFYTPAVLLPRRLDPSPCILIDLRDIRRPPQGDRPSARPRGQILQFRRAG